MANLGPKFFHDAGWLHRLGVGMSVSPTAGPGALEAWILEDPHRWKLTIKRAASALLGLWTSGEPLPKGVVDDSDSGGPSETEETGRGFP